MRTAVKVIRIDGGMVNAYLLMSDERFILVDALTAGKRAKLESALADAGCKPGNLALIVVTHGDPDHVGSSAYLHARFDAPIAMHAAETPVTESGDMKAARPNMSGFATFVFRILGRVFTTKSEDRFVPDVVVGDELDLAPYGFDARIYHTPGHSLGSASVLTGAGDLLCGDLMTSRGGKGSANSLVDDPPQMAASIEHMRELGATTVYPGHGAPFSMSEVAKA